MIIFFLSVFFKSRDLARGLFLEILVPYELVRKLIKVSNNNNNNRFKLYKEKKKEHTG